MSRHQAQRNKKETDIQPTVQSIENLHHFSKPPKLKLTHAFGKGVLHTPAQTTLDALKVIFQELDLPLPPHQRIFKRKGLVQGSKLKPGRRSR